MYCFCAIAGKRGIHIGGFVDCVRWAENLIAARRAQIVKIAKLRHGTDRYATIVCDVDSKGLWPASGGRVVDVSKIKRWHKNVQEKA